MGIMLITGSINTIANKLQQSTESLGIPYETHQKFVTFCMFWERPSVLLFIIFKNAEKRRNPLYLLFSPK